MSASLAETPCINDNSPKTVIYYNKAMRPQTYDYLSKSSVSPSMPSYRRPPNPNPNPSPYQPVRGKEPTSYHSTINSRKGSDEIKQLRHTFDSRTNQRFQELLKKSQDAQFCGVGGAYGQKQKAQGLFNSTYNGRCTPGQPDLTSSAVYGAYSTNRDRNRWEGSYNNSAKSPIHSRVDIDQKYKQYISSASTKPPQYPQYPSPSLNLSTVAPSSSSSSSSLNLSTVTGSGSGSGYQSGSDQLQRLREERRKRIEARERERQEFVRNRDKEIEGAKREQEGFKKKQAYSYYNSIYEDKNQRDKLSLSTQASPTFSKPASYEAYKSSKGDYLKDATKSPRTHVSPIGKSSVSTHITPKPKPTQSLYNGQVNGFILGKQLGEGKFGTVYQAFHKKTGSLFAIKKIPKSMIKSHLMVDQFILEVKLQMFINHENVLALFDCFDDRESVYMVLEYMDQGTLFAHLKKNKKLPQAEVAIKIKEIASSLKYLHENQIAHRDIKPENIVMTHNVCKLCDFGWSTICDQRRKTYCGTFDYAPPEILEGAQYDYSVDLWCLGVLTYELLVGKAPFYHISRKETMKKILNVQNTLIQFPDFISPTAVSFIEGLIKKDPKERITSDQLLEHPFLKYTKTKMDLKKN